MPTLTTIEKRPDESVDDAMIRHLRTHAPPELAGAVHRVCELAEHTIEPPVDTWHPVATPGLTSADRMVGLASTFPTLRRPVFETWHFETWWAELSKPWPGSGARHAIRFMLSVWNDQNPFDAHRALATWDRRHREAFVTWASRPWWC